MVATGAGRRAEQPGGAADRQPSRAVLAAGAGYALGMERLELALDAEQARFLAERASELRSTPDELVSSLLVYWLSLAREAEPLREEETVQDRLAVIAERYAAASRELFADDPDLCLDVADAADADDRSPEAAPGAEADAAPTDPLSEADVQQAFAEIAEHYAEISREVFGDEPALSAGLISGRHRYAYGVPIPDKPRSEGWLSALIDSVERRRMQRPKRSTAPSHYIFHVWLPADEPIDGPALLYVEPEFSRREPPVAADS